MQVREGGYNWKYLPLSRAVFCICLKGLVSVTSWSTLQLKSVCVDVVRWRGRIYGGIATSSSDMSVELETWITWIFTKNQKYYPNIELKAYNSSLLIAKELIISGSILITLKFERFSHFFPFQFKWTTVNFVKRSLQYYPDPSFP